MKKTITILLALMILTTSFSFANPNAIVNMIMDGRTLGFHAVQLLVEGQAVSTDVPAVIHDNRTLVPVHIIRNMGITVEWNEAAREVTIATGKKTVVMEIDSPIAIVDGEAMRLPSDVPPKIITYQNSGRTMVPIAFLRELGLIVNWDETTRTVSVENPIKEEPIEEPDKEEPILEEPVIENSVQDVNIDFSSGTPEVRIKTGTELNYTEFQLPAPDRLVFDFQETWFNFIDKSKLQSNLTFQSNVGSYGIRSVRASQFEVNPYITRLTIELDEIVPYEVFYDSSTGEMVIKLEDVTEKALNYRFFNEGYSRLELRASDVTQYDLTVSDYGKIVHVTVPREYIDLEVKDIDISDQLLEGINIGESLDGEYYHIEIRLRENVDYRGIHPRNSKDYFIEFSIGNRHGVPLIIIDPGHGGTAPGATSPINQLVEKQIVLDISQRLNKLLTESGYRTYMTRVNDTDVSLADRAGVANQLQASLYVSVHANAATNSDINGVENLYYPSEKDPDDYRDNKKLAQTFQKEMVASLGAYNRGIVPRDNLYVLRETNMPAVLSEVGFLTNPQEAAKLATAEYRQLIAESIYKSIVKYFEGIR